MRGGGTAMFKGVLIGFSLAAALSGGLYASLHLMAPPHDAPFDEDAATRLPRAATAVSSEPGQPSRSRQAERANEAEVRRALTRGIQQELSRVGCYKGAIDGRWSDATRSAMADFQHNAQGSANALAVNAPDYVLLTMLQSQSGRICGAPAGSDVAATRSNPITTGSLGQPASSESITVLAPPPMLPSLADQPPPSSSLRRAPLEVPRPRMPQAADASIDRPGLGLDADASSAEYQVTADPDPVELTAAPAKPSPDAAQRSPRQGSRASDSGRSLRETFNQISRDVP